jgi:hypothetical protein
VSASESSSVSASPSAPILAFAFGEQNPTQGETEVSWQTWSDGVGNVPTIDGDADWGKLNLDLSGEEGRSAVYDLGSSHARTFTLTENRYGTGGESAILEIRGHDTTIFSQNNLNLAWEEYTAPVSHTWRYIQTRVRTDNGFSASGAVSISANDQVVENLDITVTGSSGISGNGYSGVIIRNCTIRYAGGHGIALQNCPNVTIEHVNMLHTGAPATGEGPSSSRNGIDLNTCDYATITNVMVTDPSTGVYIQSSESPYVSNLKVINARGPFPRGQCAQFNGCPNFILDGFYGLNDTSIAWTVDGVNAYNSPDGLIQNGIIDGNNCPNGSCIQIEHGSDRVIIRNVDGYRWLNSAFSCSNEADVAYYDCHTSDSYKPDPVRGAPSSTTGLIAICYDYEAPPPTTERIIYSGIQYWNLASGNGIVWDEANLITNDFTPYNFTKRTSIVPKVPVI